ncbi:dihydroneopterin aldolase [Paenalcaligenes niemegkensis]|uniref:dihydroneopterin aldolase n=1 Tax=Paenalcaligenes niemegkensis TaxID=2895469 RepID=UPI0035645FEC
MNTTPASMPSTPVTRRIFFKNLELGARIGILEHELRATQPIHIDAEFDALSSQRVNDQDIATVLDYRQLRSAMIEECTQAHVNLLETLVEQVAARIFAEFPEIIRVHLRISKPQAFSDCDAVGIELEQFRHS